MYEKFCLNFSYLCNLDCLYNNFYHRSVFHFWYIWRTLFSFLYVLLTIYIAPILIYYFVIPVKYLLIPYGISTGAILVMNIFIILEIVAAWIKYCLIRKNKNKIRQLVSNKRIAVIVPAYLPNEINIIEKTIGNIIDSQLDESNLLEIVVVHNGGSEEQVIKLQDIVESYSDISQRKVYEIDVPYSSSKAENINEAIKFITQNQTNDDLELNQFYQKYDIAIIYDADHRPPADAIQKGLNILYQEDLDILQGRNIISKGSRIIGIEFDILYCIGHGGGSTVHGFGIFGGSNGFWKFPVLKEVGMNPNMLTEDIDSSFKALRKGYKIGYSPEVISYEQAPPLLFPFIKQRLRWAQGWFQVSLKYGLGIFSCYTKYNLYQRFTIFWLLIWREFYYYLAAQALPAGIIGLAKHGEIDNLFLILLGLSLGILIFPVIHVVTVYFVAGENKTPNIKW